MPLPKCEGVIPNKVFREAHEESPVSKMAVLVDQLLRLPPSTWQPPVIPGFMQVPLFLAHLYSDKKEKSYFLVERDNLYFNSSSLTAP